VIWKTGSISHDPDQVNELVVEWVGKQMHLETAQKNLCHLSNRPLTRPCLAEVHHVGHGYTLGHMAEDVHLEAAHSAWYQDGLCPDRGTYPFVESAV
jgi:hypothetical protein